MKLSIIFLIFSIVLISNSTFGQTSKVKFKKDEVNKKVDVFINDKFFTAFIYPDNMEKQVLYPILTSSGKTITRGYPLNPRPFERIDHPHHVGLWFNFGNVNGLDFWNNSFAIKPENKSKYGTIIFDKIISANEKTGKLITASTWVDHADNALLKEESTFTFDEKKGVRSIERTTKLTALMIVNFKENKEGLIGLRLDRSFEAPSQKPEIYLDSNGTETSVQVMNNDGVNGEYRNAEGLKGDAVWGKRSPWVALRTVKDDEILTLVILDQKKNINYPAWSHARGYGLFATNNLAGRAVDKNAPEVNITIKKGESITFKHKLIIGNEMTDNMIEQMAAEWSETN